MNEQLAKAYDPEAFRREGHQMIDLLADYLQQAQSGAPLKIMPWRTPSEQYAHWAAYTPPSPAQFYEDILAASTHLHHPHYVGHQVSPAIPVSALAGLLAGFLKNGSGVYEMAPMGAMAERYVALELGRYIGYDDRAEGIMTSGGTLANLTALLTARQKMGYGDVWNDGMKDNLDLAIMVSGESHYCIDRAVRIMGLGAEGIIKIPLGDNFRVDAAALETSYQEATARGKRIFAIVGNACSTATGSYDDLTAIGQFAKAKGIWFHTDAAHGGAALFSQKYRSLLAGIEQSDSVVIDCHKMMMTAGLATALVYREGKDSYRTFQMKAQYLFEEDQDQDWYNLAKRTFECTKFMTVLSTYQLLKQDGASTIEAYVDQTYDLAKSFYDQLLADPHFQTIHQPDANIVCFRYHRPGLSLAAANTLNKRIRESIIQSGDFYLVQTTIQGQLFLRVALMNVFTDLKVLEQLLDLVKQTAEEEVEA